MFNGRAATPAHGFLSANFDPIEVCAYVRDPAGHYLSAAQQGIKHGRDFPRFAPEFRRDTLSTVADLGVQRLLVRPFERRQLLGESIVTDFVHHCLPDSVQGRIKELPPTNTSLSPEAMLLLQNLSRQAGSLPFDSAAFRRLSKRPHRVVEAVDQRLPGKTRPALFPEVAQLAYDRADDLDWLHDTHGITFAKRPPRVFGSAEAAEKLAALRGVTQICAVDQPRYKALCQHVQTLLQPSRGLSRLWRKPNFEQRLSALFPGETP